MINEKSIEAIKKAEFSSGFIKPLYDTYCFSNIPQTIKNILIPENKIALPKDILGNKTDKYDKVILFLIDGFGWGFFDKYKKDFPFLQRFIDKGVISKLTSQYPSTTAAEVTTIHTGLPVGQHGIYEWFCYEPKLDAIIAPLLFSFAGKKIRNTLSTTDIDPKTIYPQENIYKQLLKKGIKTTMFLDEEFAFSPYNASVNAGANIIPYITLPEALITLVEKIKTDRNKGYYFLYFNKIDTMAHRYGPDSLQCKAEIMTFCSVMEEIFYKNMKKDTGKTLFLMTADHGQININPEDTVYINLQFPKIVPWVKTNKNGDLLAPAGTCRDMYIHIKDEFLDEAQQYLQKQLVNKAEVYKTKILIEQKFYGKEMPTNVFLERVGNLAILCKNSSSVWWYEKDKFEQKFKGHHGSLTKEEMEIPLTALVF